MMDSILEANLMDKLEMFYNLLCFIFGVPVSLLFYYSYIGNKNIFKGWEWEHRIMLIPILFDELWEVLKMHSSISDSL